LLEIALEMNERKGMATAQRLPNIPCLCVFSSSLFGVFSSSLFFSPSSLCFFSLILCSTMLFSYVCFLCFTFCLFLFVSVFIGDVPGLLSAHGLSLDKHDWEGRVGVLLGLGYLSLILISPGQ
jgi:hypothetical protein